MNRFTAGNAEDAERTKDQINSLTSRIIDAAIKVHRALGPGLLESAYEACLCHELTCLGCGFERQKPLPLIYGGITVECGYRLDLLVERCVIVELKAVESIQPIHEAQLLSYLRLSGCKVGLLINFNVTRLRDGVRRMVNQF